MKVLVFGDTHGIDDFSYLEELAKDADMILCLGDITFFMSDIDAILEGLSLFAEKMKKPFLITHGNHEYDLDVFIEDYPSLIYLHEEVFEYNGVCVIGHGGAGFSRREPRVQSFFDTVYSSISFDQKSVVWLFHAPPHKTVDFRPDWGYCGSITRRELIEKYAPSLVVAGHIHDAIGTQVQVNTTHVVNPGPGGMLIEIHSKMNSTSMSSSTTSTK